MCVWTIDKSIQIADNEDIRKLRIFKLPNKPLYHYTSREVFWKIVDSETLLARHIMFSNDTEENAIGTNKINQIMNEKSIDTGDIESLPFMICFCEKEDLLSQWRGYANEGIALEFDFSKGLYGHNSIFSPYHCFTIMNNDECENSGNNYTNQYFILKNGDKETKTYFMGAIAAPFHVIYTDKSMAHDKIIEECVNKIIKWCDQWGASDLKSQRIADLIPYIKNNKFEEESEYRLIFNMKKLLQEDKWQILDQKYINLEIAGIRKPNIRVKFGNQMDSEKEDICIYYGDDTLQDFLRTIKQELKKDGFTLKLKKSASVQKDEIIMSNGKFQEEICYMLRRKMRLYSYSDRLIKVWCDGHLPIRKIIVGPSKDAEYMVHSIQEYIRTKYWMRDIQVVVSKIPLRT